MNKIIKTTMLASLFASSALFADTTTWYSDSTAEDKTIYIVDEETSVDKSFSDTVNWDSGVVPTSGDVNLGVSIKTDTSFAYNVSLDEDATFDNFTLSLTPDVIEGSNYNLTSITLNTQNLTVNGTLSVSGNTISNVYEVNTGNLNVTGNLTADEIVLANGGTITVSDTLIANTVSASGYAKTIKATYLAIDEINVSVESLTISGAANATNDETGQTGIGLITLDRNVWASKIILSQTYGLTVDEIQMVSSTGATGSARTIQLSQWASTQSLYLGKITDSRSDDTLLLAGSTVKLYMTGVGDFAGIVQGTASTNTNVYFTDGSDQTFTGTTTITCPTFNYDILSGGKLTASSAAGINVYVRGGGTLGVGDSQLDMSTLYIEDSATLFFDLANYDSSAMIAVDSTFTKSSETDTLILDFGEFLLNPETTDTYYLISFDNSSLEGDEYVVTSDDFVLDSSLVEAGWTITEVNGTFVLSNVAVPEPSTYAMIFGALALGLAIYRKRK